MESWYVLTVLAIGVAIVIGGVLLFRLHAFLALIIAALTVSALTTPVARERAAIVAAGVEVVAIDPARGTVTVAAGEDTQLATDPAYLIVRQAETGAPIVDVGRLRIASTAAADDSSRTLVVDSEYWGTMVDARPGDFLVTAPERRAAAATARRSVGVRVAEDFGDTCAKIAILIAMASIIGKCLLDSGAADRIVRSALRVVGERGAPGAFVGSGFVLAIPVFFDTVFYLMIPLGKAKRMRTGKSYLFYVLAICAGGTMAHSLVPPTPGPLFMAGELGVDLGLMIIGGCIAGIFASFSGYLYARWANRTWDIPLR
ncbi:MAG: GntP family permease, partial [Planctomycetes bacterium]|nr:GntP family permease [Planctomycetota bacterium]